MRTEQEMMELILGVARRDVRIRAVGMNGSRTNPNAPKDRFQDYDIVYLVTDMASFIADPSWVDVFGERIIMQMPEQMTLFPPDLGGWFSYLMLFVDGNRIDLILVPWEERDKYCADDSLTVILLDKDGALPALPPPTDNKYWVKRPSAAEFADCCNEFWWVSTCVAKGLWREELVYAHAHLDSLMRPMLLMMLEWLAGLRTEFSVNTGKQGKYLQKHLPPSYWETMLRTYADGREESVWDALLAMTALFGQAGREAASGLGFVYPEEEDRRVTAYVREVRSLPGRTHGRA